MNVILAPTTVTIMPDVSIPMVVTIAFVTVDTMEMVSHVHQLMLTNVQMERTTVTTMPLVPTPSVVTHVPVTVATLVMDTVVQSLM